MATAPERIIEVLLDEQGSLTYRLRTSLLNTRDYGRVLATIARQIAVMFELEGRFDREQVLTEILHAIANEAEQPTINADITMMQ